MLGTNTVKSHIKSSRVIDLRPRVVAEWNINSISNPYLYGTSTAPTNFTTLSLTASPSSPAISNVNRGTSNAIFSDTTCQSIYIDGSSNSVSVSHRAVVNGVASLITRQASGIQIGQTINVSGVDPDLDGVHIATQGTQPNIIVYDTGNASLNKNLNRVKPDGEVSSNTSSYYADIDLTNVSTKSIRLFMKLKSDYENYISAPNISETVTGSVTLFGYRNGNPVFTQVSNKNFIANSSEWTQLEMTFANPDEETPLTSVRLTLDIDSKFGESLGLLVDEIIAFEVSEYEVYSEDRLPLKEVFDVDRPGEILMDYGPIDVSVNDTDSFAKQSSPVHMASQYALGPYFEKVQRSVAPFAKNPYSYYVSGSDLDSKKIWCLYDTYSKINRIVIKVNAIAAKPKLNNFVIKIFTSTGWQTINTSNMNFSSSGILDIYYKSGAWSTNKWQNNAIPKFNESSNSISDFVQIRGVAVEVLDQDYVVEDSPLSVDPAIDILELVEISPRLEVDLSPYLLSIDVNKELESSDIPLPIGRITSNSSRISFTTVPIIYNSSDTTSIENDDVIPISNYATTSPFKNMLVKGVKLKTHFDLDLENRLIGPTADKVKIPAFVMYAERWSESQDRVEVECFDSVKKLQSMPARPIYLEDKSINEIIFSVLDSVGFGDYIPDELFNLDCIKYGNESNPTKPSIKYFWGKKEQSVTDLLNDLFKPYQVSMFVDEYGILRFTSLLDFKEKIKNQVPTSDILYVQDTNENSSISNLQAADLEDIERPEKIILKYRTPTPSISDYRQKKKDNTINFLSTATDIVWEPEQEAKVLPFFELSSPGIITPVQDRIKFDITNTLASALPFSGYLLIDQEIVKYDGIEYIFTIVGDDEYSKTVVVRGLSDIERSISEIFQEKKTTEINWTSTGYLVNVSRGMFGTVAAPHKVSLPGKRTGWRGREFDRQYKNVSSIEESDGEYGSSSGGIFIKSKKTSGGIFIFPSENNTVDKKRRFFSRYLLNAVPAGKTGYLGSLIGIEIDQGNIKNGLFIWTGIKSKNKQYTITMKIDQVVNGEIKSILAEKDFDFSDELFDAEETIECFAEFNANMDEMKVYIGSTSLFQTVKEKKNPKSGKTVEFKTEVVRLKSRIKKDGLFGFGALQIGQGLLDALAFTVRSNPRNLNDIEINNLDDSYGPESSNKTSPGYYIGADTLLDNIVYNKFISGFNVMKDSFVFTGAPVARGIEIFEVDYQDYPVVDAAEAEFLGYTYDINAIQKSNEIEGSEKNK